MALKTAVLRRELREPFFALVFAFVVLAALLAANPSPEEYDLSAEFYEFEDLPQQSPDVLDEKDAPLADAADVPSWLEYTIRRGDTMARILHKIGADKEARDFLLAQKLKSF